MEAYACCCSFQAMQKCFGLVRCICQYRYVIGVVGVGNCCCGISSASAVLFQVIQFSISIHFSSIWLIDKTLSGATNPGQSEPGSDGNEGVLLHFPNLQYYWSLSIRLFIVISRTLVGDGLTPLQRSCCCNLQPQPTWQVINRTLIGVVLPLCRDAVGIFYSQSSFICPQLNSFKYCYLTLVILLHIIYSFAHSKMVPSIAM